MSASFALLPFAFPAVAEGASLPCDDAASFPDFWAFAGLCFPLEACFGSVTVFFGARSGFLDATATSLLGHAAAPTRPFDRSSQCVLVDFASLLRAFETSEQRCLFS